MSISLLLVTTIVCILGIIYIIFVALNTRKSINTSIVNKSRHLQSLLRSAGKKRKYSIQDAIPIPCYYINLDRSIGRRKKMEKITAPISNRTTRVPAIDGKKMEDAGIMHGIQYVTNFKLSSSQIACTLSHIKTIKMIEDAGHDAALVLEDDASFDLVPFWPNDYINHILETMPENTGIIQLYWGKHEKQYCQIHDKHELVEQDPRTCYGTVAYIITRKGVNDILSYALPYRKGKIHLSSTNGYPISGVADVFLYQLTNVYNTSLPLMTFNGAGFQSTIFSKGDIKNLTYYNNIVEKYLKIIKKKNM